MSRIYRNKQEYISALREVLSAREDFKALELHKHPSTQEEFLFLTDIIGSVYMFDVTGMKNEDIFHVMAMLDCGEMPTCYIADKDRMFELGKMFN